MKKIYTIGLALLLIAYHAHAQKIGFRSNGHINEFTKIDTLFFTEYAGKKPSTRTAAIDTVFSKGLLQFDSSFGFTTRNLTEATLAGNKLTRQKKLFTTSFYRYKDGTLQAPTSVLFFQPTNHIAIKIFTKYGAITPHPDLKGYYYLHLKTSVYNNGDKILALCDSLYNAGIAAIIEPVFIRRIRLATDPLLPNEWNISNTGQTGGTTGADMKVSNVWSMGYTGAGIKVAVIDLGVDLNHPDLQANLLTGYDATGNNSGGGPQYDAYNTHGTECAGIIAEVQNTIGGVGVAYNAKIIPIRLGIGYLDAATGQVLFNTTDTWKSSCFSYAVNNGADIISNSWTSGSSSAQVDAAIANAVTNGRGGKGSIVLFAAGNNNSAVLYPASNSNAIAVGASCECDTRKRSSSSTFWVNPGVSTDPLDVSCDGEYWWGSNYGTNLDILAPGVHITTTTLPNGTDYTNAYDGAFNGTSAATPNTAGVLALLLSANPNLTGQQARTLLESTADKIGGYSYQSNIPGQPNGTWCADAGYGRVNACAAITKALNSTLSINGDASFCTTSNPYSITNLPAGATVSWSASPAGSVSISTSGNTATLTVTGIGQVTLTASVATGSPCAVTVQKTISVGIPIQWGNITDLNNTSLTYCPYGQFVTFTFNPSGAATTPVTDYVWAYYDNQTTSSINPILGGISSSDWPTALSALPAGTYTVSVRPENACGAGNIVEQNFFVTNDFNQCGGGGGLGGFSVINGTASITGGLAIKIAVYPNPVHNNLTIVLPPDSIDVAHAVISVTDAYGRTIKKVTVVNTSNTISMANTASGVYFVDIYDGKKRIVKKVVKD
ncbi:peptidase S8/S53 domain-containing protein [Russula earlei]|uniref:Peptidase S8/S53 domain-containing protein n=1 Tax=Russula earlei TaxID=71964 RepID=A0ACC0U554_9AGAM|nr:peptidase S8/S53 domain-containing protein [Russula earlei]